MSTSAILAFNESFTSGRSNQGRRGDGISSECEMDEDEDEDEDDDL